MKIQTRLTSYIQLMRLDKPIGILLLLWPTLWALWLSANGQPDFKVLGIFVLGVILMRSAGCVINDIADRNFDGHVSRTKYRPLASGQLQVKEALFLLMVLVLLAFSLVLQCNTLTILLSFIGVGLALVYPFLKRITHLPQVGLGAAFAWGVPMAFAAQINSIPNSAWLVFAAALLWPVIYDTMYAMVDREDDIKIGIKSTAILFGHYDGAMLGLLQILLIILLAAIGLIYHLKTIYYISLSIVGTFFLYQLFLLSKQDKEAYFRAFLNNNWVGFILFLGIYLSTLGSS